MSDNQLAAMMIADDAYAGSESFYRLADVVREILGFEYTIPVHQGRAAEHLLAKVFVKPGDVIPMNYHFTTTKAHFEVAYGGMSIKEVEAMTVGLREMTEFDVASASPEFIEYFVGRLLENGLPAVTPAGGLACHIDAKRFLPHLSQTQYPAGALAAAIYLASGVRSMERGTISMDRDAEGNDVPADLELARLAVPRRVYTLSQIEYAVDRLTWLYKHRDLVGGLKFVEKPKVLRFFFGRLAPLDNWGARLADAFQAEFGTAV